MSEWEALATAALKLAAAFAGGMAVHAVLFRVAVVMKDRWWLDEGLVRRLAGPLRAVLPLLTLSLVLPSVSEIGPAVQELLHHALSVAVIASITWLVTALADAGADVLLRRYDIGLADNLDARRMYTQIQVLERTVIVVIVVLGVGAALMTFPRIREIGASLLVSAGVAGLAVGLAARPVLENLIAGLQLAFTQPIRVDDVVVVEGEWGRIEEITTTYVVVHIWDERRLIVPFSRFISQSFQNWTRRTAQILGTVTLRADYTVPVAVVREELKRVCAASDLWDGRVCNLQVTDAGERTIELRALVSASNSGRGWDLRVHVREQLVAFLQQNHPGCLPTARVALDSEAPDVPVQR